MKPKREQTIDRIVGTLFKEEFGDVPLNRIDVVRDEDWEGDPILRITVVVQNPENLDSDRLSSFVRRIRNYIVHRDSAFPLVGFRSVRDDEGLKSAAA